MLAAVNIRTRKYSRRVHTVRRRQICVRGSLQWALDVYNQLHDTQSSFVTMSALWGCCCYSVYCSTATSNAASGTAHAQCCFGFFTGRIPARQIISVTKTPSRCHENGFIITDAKGRDICVSQNLPWAQKAFEQQQLNIESAANPQQGNSKH
ncbi:C-C motif chemokine 3-like [Toxotes jaculatrix]|uniref:C-C motif chemokine 3-like n=1 Tax=Toxotes jaculatrix TaxID=941984 RepID=UPI001B3AD80C|nr:C-C motif chemokine 3-like [Toxotes jaculatrix]